MVFLHEVSRHSFEKTVLGLINPLERTTMFCVHQGTLAGVCARGSSPKDKISIFELIFQTKSLVLKQRSFLGRQNSAGCDLPDFVSPLLEQITFPVALLFFILPPPSEP